MQRAHASVTATHFNTHHALAHTHAQRREADEALFLAIFFAVRSVRRRRCCPRTLQAGVRGGVAGEADGLGRRVIQVARPHIVVVHLAVPVKVGRPPFRLPSTSRAGVTKRPYPYGECGQAAPRAWVARSYERTCMSVSSSDDMVCGRSPTDLTNKENIPAPA